MIILTEGGETRQLKVSMRSMGHEPGANLVRDFLTLRQFI